MKTILLSSLNKVFKDTAPNATEFTEFSSLKNENFSFQVAYLPETKDETEPKIRIISSLADDIAVYFVRNIPAGTNGFDNSDSFHYNLKRKEFPDLLEPIEGKLKLKKENWYSFWIEYKPTKDVVGEQKIEVEITADGKTQTKIFTLNILNHRLPKQELLFTNWFHNDCICTYYNIDVFSDEYWSIVERFIKNASERGVNMLLTPVFTPPLDTAVGGERPTVQLVGVTKNGDDYSFDFTNFRKYVNICLRNGIEAFEISHFFTQWGAKHAPKIIATVDGKEKQIFGWKTNATGKEYKEFLTAFSVAFKREVEETGIKDRCWLHVSDEPNEKQIRKYKAAAKIIRELFEDFNMLDALSDIRYYKNGIIKTPVCGEEEADVFRAAVKDFWTYYCCTHVHNTLPNRMFSQPSVRNRILGILLYKYDAKGFLQWGHNFWYSQYSKHPIDPYKVTDAGGSFPSGDSFVVYPGKGGRPLNSLRHIVFADAFQDLRALKLLESYTSREYVLNLIEKDLDIPLSFKTYPHEQRWLLNLRKTINEEIAK